jgi:hypothetical protein
MRVVSRAHASGPPREDVPPDIAKKSSARFFVRSEDDSNLLQIFDERPMIAAWRL